MMNDFSETTYFPGLHIISNIKTIEKVSEAV
jgi:hypothetical protein